MKDSQLRTYRFHLGNEWIGFNLEGELKRNSGYRTCCGVIWTPALAWDGVKKFGQGKFFIKIGLRP